MTSRKSFNCHAGDNPEAKASEMEHAIRKHCTVHFDEDPAFYRHLLKKLEHLLQKHREKLECPDRRTRPICAQEAHRRSPGCGLEGLDREETTFYEHLAHLVFGGTGVPLPSRDAMKRLAPTTIEILPDPPSDIIDFWANPDEQQQASGAFLGDALLMMDMPELNHDYERLAVEIL